MAGRQPAWVRRGDASHLRTEILSPRAVTHTDERTTYGAPPPALVAVLGRGAGYANQAWNAVWFAGVVVAAWSRAAATITRLRVTRLALEHQLNGRIAALGRSAFEGDADGAELARARAHDTAEAIAEGRAAEGRVRERTRARIEQARRRR